MKVFTYLHVPLVLEVGAYKIKREKKSIKVTNTNHGVGDHPSYLSTLIKLNINHHVFRIIGVKIQKLKILFDGGNRVL